MDTASVHRERVRRALFALAILVLLVATALLSPQVESGRADGPQAEVVPGELVVTFTPNATERHTERAITKTGGEVEQRIASSDGVVISVEPDRAEVTVKRLMRDRVVQHVEPNYVVRAARLPNDRSFGEQWGLRNLGHYGGKSGADIGATSAWDATIGGSAPVAVVDTGVSFKHPDLASNAWVNPGDPLNGHDDDGDGFEDDVNGADFLNGDSTPDDDGGHGTHVAGIIGAQGNNSVGISGINWEAQVMGLKFLDGNGEGNTADAANAIDYAVDHGARVINASWGGPAFSLALYSAIRRAHEHGVLFVAASGNDGMNADSSPDYPAAFDLPNIISVAATDRSDRLLDFSNYGAKSVDLAAPGDDIYSTVPPVSDPSGYAAFSGTSMAAPFVAGAAALYLSKFPQATADQVRAALLNTVDRLPTLAGKTVTGGRLNMANALGATSPSTGPQRDTTPPSTFALIRPRSRLKTRKRGLRFAWQRSRDASGIRLYKLYVNRKRVRTVRDKDGPGGREPKPRTRFRLRRGKHRWFVRAYDYAGNRRTSRAFKRSKGKRKSSVLWVKKRKSRR
ncbi:MAG: S8 family peptidase [Solirubrobacterales bacterium]